MKKIYTLCALAFAALTAFASPARPGQWKTVRLADGTEVRVELKGDEWGSYWQAADGKTYVEDGETGIFKPVDVARMLKATEPMRLQRAQDRAVRLKKLYSQNQLQASTSHKKAIAGGKKKGLIILVNYPDGKSAQFQPEHTRELLQEVANGKNYTNKELGFTGSVADYFRSQSLGKLDIEFDVVGPYMLAHKRWYYGTNQGYSHDTKSGEMIAEAVLAADADVNYADYDWDGDGEVDQVFVLYAGLGEHDGGSASTIWPHESKLSASDYKKAINLDGVKIDTYACSSELQRGSTICGIGTICHEFSHCLGFPDTYDPTKTRFGMGTWDLMDVGSYIDNGFTPSCYTGLERMIAGWQNAKVLANDTIVNNMGPISEGGEFFIVYNEGYKNEFYILENHQNVGWDAKRKGTGLLVNYVDYDERVWTGMAPNASGDYARCTIICADGYNYDQYPDDNCFPYGSVNSLTDNSEPAATLNHANVNGKKLMGKPITDIHRNADGTMGFTFKREVELSNTPNPWDNLVVDGIAEVNAATQAKADNRIYTLDGRFLGTDMKALKSGMYIVNGKKILK